MSKKNNQETLTMRRRCNHDEVFPESAFLYEIPDGSGGMTRVYCDGNYHDVLRGMKLLRRVSLPQNAAAPQAKQQAPLTDSTTED